VPQIVPTCDGIDTNFLPLFSGIEELAAAPCDERMMPGIKRRALFLQLFEEPVR